MCTLKLKFIEKEKFTYINFFYGSKVKTDVLSKLNIFVANQQDERDFKKITKKVMLSTVLQCKIWI